MERRLFEADDELHRTASQCKAEFLDKMFGISSFSIGGGGVAPAMQPNALSVVPPRDNIVGVGYGARSTLGVEIQGEIAVRVYVRNKLPRRVLHKDVVIPSDVNGIPTDVIPVGDLSALTRPTPCGVSVGHYAITAGTLGCLVRSSVGANKDFFILSNNHVLANCNKAEIGDLILEPGPSDGGQEQDPIARLTDFEEIKNGAANFMDAAIAELLDPKHVIPEILDIGYVQSPIMTSALYQSVRKRGRTTHHTVGIISDLSADIRVRYGTVHYDFEDQLGIDGIRGQFGYPGDSGSLIVDAVTRRPVGLLFAGGSGSFGVTFANPIGQVFERFNVEPVYGEQEPMA